MWEADELEESEEDELTGEAFPQQLVTALACLVVSAAAAVAAVVVADVVVRRLSPFMVPSHWMFVSESFIRLPSGGDDGDRKQKTVVGH